MDRQYPYYFNWATNPKRVGMIYRPCKVLARGRMNSVLIEFRDGAREITSRNALRKMPPMLERCK